MKTAIVDDRREDRERLAQILQAYAAEKELPLQLSFFESGEALTVSCFAGQYDLIFLDVFMGSGMTGVQTAECIRNADAEVKLIFLTESREHQSEAIHWHVFDYLNKDQMELQVPGMLDRALKKPMAKDEKQLSFILDKTSVSLPYDQLLYLTSDRNYLIIHDLTLHIYRTRMTFTRIWQELQRDPRFLPVLRGVIINMDYLMDLSAGVCTLRGNVRLPVNIRKTASLEQAWTSYTFAKIHRQAEEEDKHAP